METERVIEPDGPSVEPVVLLPGMMCDARLFEPQILDLSRDRVVSVALPANDIRIERIARLVLDQLPARFALAGHGLGGMVAMEMVRRAPDRVTRLCLMDTNPLAETPAVAASREPMIVAARAGNLDEVLRESIRPDHCAPGPAHVEVLNRVFEMGQDLGEEVFVAQSRAMQRRGDQQGTLRRCKLPTMVICGEHDTLTPVKRHQFMSELMPNAQLRIIEGAGHLPMLEQPGAVNVALRDWLEMPTCEAETVPDTVWLGAEARIHMGDAR